MSKISHSLEMNNFFECLLVDDIIIIFLPFPYVNRMSNDNDDHDDDTDDDYDNR